MSDNQQEDIKPTLSDKDFKDKLAETIPHLRAFGRGLCHDADAADDLVQETMMKAWAARARFVAGTSFKAWTFTILRNHYFSQMRRKRFVGDWDDVVADRKLAAPAGQDMSVELRDMMRALAELPDPQREALILVGAGGLSYEEAAEIMGTAVGTVKSRVSRARATLEALIDGGVLTTKWRDFEDGDQAVISIFADLEKIQARRAPVPIPIALPLLPTAA
ncbi:MULTISPECIES: sigma-70 family RNA polymerase sigma factor [Sphingobium]|uniref:sigma-70 family RNA polymerase sigma factor n=1 Tax=Sphingobium TaxID=165695 RepID=UPI000785377D|nr:sigma-70 family RNA polymerase sigma factor [Sphingobium abikonense]KXU29851.1 RNA polymerase subunit sigma-24 [Sphingobium sp. AM]KYC30399.1 RNA polymerase subunit sigma-24 [Sphingobium sp. 22B]MEC6701365.1 sigma-70 family RNA polymerase sigma factor [Sphingobium sp. SJ10-10]NML91070.1 sigma-70 family RNA polymerase sigma factor [Sphingobium sp. TB-6]OAP29990.1 RNA polymerase subunit sigma-24 [Sphingobium sp. 20006FA]